ncbi:MAG: hypothetical protein Q8M29_19100 [Bacteroidota bacterium]|nr:hypothetical protein [Bacteroidota bacterium]
MKIFINTLVLLLFMQLFLGCSKIVHDDTKALPDPSKHVFILSPGTDTTGIRPEIIFEISDSTFTTDPYFNYYVYINQNSPTDLRFRAYYTTFSLIDKEFRNPAYLTFNYQNTDDLTGASVYKIKYNANNNVQTVTFNDTANWVEMPNVLVDPLEKTYKIPINDFLHVYFMAKKP